MAEPSERGQRERPHATRQSATQGRPSENARARRPPARNASDEARGQPYTFLGGRLMAGFHFERDKATLHFPTGSWTEMSEEKFRNISKWARGWARTLRDEKRRADKRSNQSGVIWSFEPVGRVTAWRRRESPFELSPIRPRKPYRCSCCDQKTTRPGWRQAPETYRGHSRKRFCDACVQRGGRLPRLRLVLDSPAEEPTP